MTLSPRLKRRRNKLFAEDPHCHWCTVELVYYNPGELKKGESLPDNFATIDHLNTRFDLTRWENHDQPQTVLACYKCNKERGFAKIKEVGDKINKKTSQLIQAKRKGQLNLTRKEIAERALHD